MKKFLSMCLTVLLLLTIIPFSELNSTAYAESFETIEYERLKYEIVNDEAILIGHTYLIDPSGVGLGSLTLSYPESISIPDSVYGYPVVEISSNAFYNTGNYNGGDRLKEIIVPKSVKKIGDNAFSGLNNLNIIFNCSNLEYLGNDVFSGTKWYNNLTSLLAPEGLIYIGKVAFKYVGTCPEEIELKAGTTSISNDAFKESNIRRIVLPSTLKNIGDYAFYKSKIEKIEFPNNLESIGKGAFKSCDNLVNISIPKNVKTIKDEAFNRCHSLKTLNFSATDNIFGRDVFAYSVLNKINISNDVKKINNYAFENCEYLKNVNFGNSVKEIGISAFSGCKNLLSIDLPDSVERLGDNAFSNCENLTQVTLSKNISRISKGAMPSAVEEVFYRGSKTMAEKIAIVGNVDFTKAKWYYNSCIGKAKHTYSNACDTSCNVCKAARSITHTYKTTTTKATTSKNGKIVKECTICGDVESTTTIKYAKTFSLSSTSYTYNGKVKTPTVTVKDSAGNKLKKNVDYTLTSSSGRTNVGTYKVTVKLIGKYSGTKTLTFKNNPAKLGSSKLSATTYTYNGKVKTPTVTVKNSAGTKLKKNVDYTLTSSSGRKNVGTYKVTIKGKGNYTGTKTLTFKINPANTTVSKLTAGTKSFTVNITKKSTQVTGYQVQYSTSKSFTSAKTATITSYKTTKATVKSLSAKKTYYVRVRTYKTVNGTKYYSGWSTYKSVKTK